MLGHLGAVQPGDGGHLADFSKRAAAGQGIICDHARSTLWQGAGLLTTYPPSRLVRWRPRPATNCKDASRSRLGRRQGGDHVGDRPPPSRWVGPIKDRFPLVARNPGAYGSDHPATDRVGLSPSPGKTRATEVSPSPGT